MKEKSNINQSLSLIDFKLFTKSDLDVFSHYGISTLEQLLGATKGLSNTLLFDNLEHGELMLAKIKQFVGETELRKYKDFDSNYPTGLIIDDHEEIS